MSKNKILLGLLGITMIGAVGAFIYLGGTGNLLQGALYNLRPIYTECKIEGTEFNSTNKDDCENFHKKFQEGAFPDGEYTISAKYEDKRLKENIIPVVIEGTNLSCPFTEKGYIPKIEVYNPKSPLSSETLKEGQQDVPVGDNGLIAQINYNKDGQKSFYDTNICEAAFLATILEEEEELGTAKLDHNGFINSRELVNEVLIANSPYYSPAQDLISKSFSPGNVFVKLNSMPDITFKFEIPCSHKYPEVKIPSIETDQDTNINFNGLTEKYLKTCGSKLYLSFQNTDQKDDIQVINNLTLIDEKTLPTYQIKLRDLARVAKTGAEFPITYQVSLHLRDRSDAKDIVTLGHGVLTVTGYTPGEKVKTSTSTGTSSTETTPERPTEEIATEERVKVRNNSNTRLIEKTSTTEERILTEEGTEPTSDDINPLTGSPNGTEEGTEPPSDDINPLTGSPNDTEEGTEPTSDNINPLTGSPNGTEEGTEPPSDDINPLTGSPNDTDESTEPTSDDINPLTGSPNDTDESTEPPSEEDVPTNPNLPFLDDPTNGTEEDISDRTSPNDIV